MKVGDVVMSIRVIIVDDHDTVRRGLAVFLRSFDDFDLVGEASDGKEAVDLCAELEPDVIIMDIIMPVMDGISATRLIREKHPDIQVIALTSFDEDDTVKDMMAAGACAFLFKDVATDELADAIRSAVPS